MYLLYNLIFDIHKTNCEVLTKSISLLLFDKNDVRDIMREIDSCTRCGKNIIQILQV